MKHLLSILFSLIFIFIGYSQITLKQIDAYKKEDSIKVEMIVDYCVNSTFDQTEEILKLAQKAYSISKKIKYELGEIHSLSCIGNYYYLIADYKAAVQYYNQSLLKAERINDTHNIIIGYNNLANLYSKARQPQKAIQLFKKSDELLMKNGDSLSQNRAAILVNLSDVYNTINDSKHALLYLKKALYISEKIKSDFGIIICNSNIGAILTDDARFEEAFPFLEIAYNSSLAIQNSFLLAQIEANLGTCYAEKNQKMKAESYFESAIKHAILDQNKEALVSIYQKTQNFYEKFKDYRKAHYYLKKYVELSNKISSDETKKIISEINTKYETTKKEARIKSLNQSNKISKLESQQKSDWIIGIVGFVLTLSIFAIFLFSRYKQRKENQLLTQQFKDAQLLLETERKVSESEIKAIKSQMNPHFFYNALNSIQGFVLTGEKQKASESIGLFSDLSRAILESSRHKEISLADELELLESYLKLEQMRLPKIAFKFLVADNVPTYDCFIPPMILQPIIENSVKHGLANKTEGGTITIEIQMKGDDIKVIIDDDGIGREASENLNRFRKKSSSFSSEANLNRIELLNEIHDLKIKQVIIDKVADGKAIGTRVELTFPQVIA